MGLLQHHVCWLAMQRKYTEVKSFVEFFQTWTHSAVLCWSHVTHTNFELRNTYEYKNEYTHFKESSFQVTDIC